MTLLRSQETSAYRVIWQSDKRLDFEPGTSDGSTTVLFDRMGAIKIWAEIQKRPGAGCTSRSARHPSSR